MKYIITDSEFQPAIVLGHDVSHADLKKSVIGRVASAGEVRVEDGLVRTYGKSIGLGMVPDKRDASLIATYLGLGHDKVHPESL